MSMCITTYVVKGERKRSKGSGAGVANKGVELKVPGVHVVPTLQPQSAQVFGLCA